MGASLGLSLVLWKGRRKDGETMGEAEFEVVQLYVVWNIGAWNDGVKGELKWVQWGSRYIKAIK